MNKLSAILFLFLLLFEVTHGQEMLGVINSNYAGIYGLKLNPSLTTTSRLYMDYNLMGIQGFVDNDYAYVSNKDFFNIIFKKEGPVYFTSENEERSFAINRDNLYKNGFQDLSIFGPSGMMVLGKHGFGLTTGFRTLSSFNNLPPDIANFLYEAIDFDVQHEINYEHDNELNVASLSWFELGINYAYILKRHKWDYWSAGLTLKPLFGTSAFFSSIDHVNYTVHNDTTASVYDATFAYGFSLPVNYQTNAWEPGPLFKGYGLGLDIGVTYMFTRKGEKAYYFEQLCEQDYEAYNFKIGFSILDIGFIKFSKKAILSSYDHVSTVWYKPYDTLSNSSLNDLVTKIDRYFGDAAAGETKSDDSFTMTLPPIASLQADYWMKDNFYLSLMVFYPLNIFKNNYFYRPSIIALTPRYETARFEINIPISIYDFKAGEPKIGFSARFGNFFFGTDGLNNYLGLSNFTGADFYAGLRMNLSNVFKMNFIKGQCGMKKVYNVETFDYRNF